MNNKNEDNKKKCNYWKINNYEEKNLYKKKNAEKESANNVAEDVIYKSIFIAKISNQNHDRKISISYSGATSYMLNLKENMTNLKDKKQESP